MFRASAFCDGIASVIAECLYCLAELFVILFVAVSPFDSFSDSFGELHLHFAMLFDLFVCEFDGLKHFSFADLFHLTLDHHDVVVCGSDHNVDVGLGHFTEVRVDFELAVDSCHSYL